MSRIALRSVDLPVTAFRLGRIERYVLKQQARSLAVALAVIASLVMLIDFVEISRGVGQDVDLSAFQIVGLMLLKRLLHICGVSLRISE